MRLKIYRIKPDIVLFDKFEVEEDVVKKIKEIINPKVILFDNKYKANAYADTVINAIVRLVQCKGQNLPRFEIPYFKEGISKILEQMQNDQSRC